MGMPSKELLTELDKKKCASGKIPYAKEMCWVHFYFLGFSDSASIYAMYWKKNGFKYISWLWKPKQNFHQSFIIFLDHPWWQERIGESVQITTSIFLSFYLNNKDLVDVLDP